MKHTIPALATVFAAMLLGGCATFMGQKSATRMSVSQLIPAAEGSVSFEKTRNGNTGIDLLVKHLAKPEKLNPPAQTYVVWVKGSGEESPQNIGALAVDKDLNARLKTLTPLTVFDLFITSEPNGQVRQPGGERLLWTTYSR